MLTSDRLPYYAVPQMAIFQSDDIFQCLDPDQQGKVFQLPRANINVLEYNTTDVEESISEFINCRGAIRVTFGGHNDY